MSTIRNLLNRIRSNSHPQDVAETLEHRFPPTNPVLNLQIQEALNGKVISFTRFKYNPNGPDEREQIMYVVGPDDSIVDGISTCITLMEARHAK